MLVARGNRTDDQWKGTDDFVSIILVIAAYVISSLTYKGVISVKSLTYFLVVLSSKYLARFFLHYAGWHLLSFNFGSWDSGVSAL